MDRTAVDPVNNPLVFAHLAAEVAGFQVGEVLDGEGYEPEMLDGDFSLEFEFEGGMRLELAHSREENRFLLMFESETAFTNQEGLLFAMRANALLGAGSRFGVHPEREDHLIFTDTLGCEGLGLETLAAAMSDMGALFMAALDRENDKSAPPPEAAPRTDTSAFTIRG